MAATKRTTCEAVPARVALALLTSAGVVVLYILRINMSVAIVAMVDITPSLQDTQNSSLSSTDNNVAYCTVQINVNRSTATDTGANGIQKESSTAQREDYLGNYYFNATAVKAETDSNDDLNNKMELTTAQRGLVLGAFFYGYFATNIPGGRLAEMYGTKRVFGGAILIGGILTLFIPLAAKVHYSVLVLLRVLTGLAHGVVYPAMNVMVARWIPPLERPRFMSFAYMSNTVGTVVTMPLCGLIIAWVGWPYVFYFSGGVSLLWVLVWGLLMHDTPQQHPRISPEEMAHILHGLEEETKKEKPSRTPWRSIMTSIPLWATTFAHIGSMFGFNLLLTQLPTYMATILGFSITNNGFLSALPFLAQFLGSTASGLLGDWMLTRKYITVNASRKLFATVSLMLPGLLLVVVGYTGCHATLAVVFLCLGTAGSGAICSGHMANHLDLSPNFAGTIMGVSNTLAFMVSMCVPVIVGAMTPDQTLDQWQRVFWLAAGIYIVNWLIFVVFSSTDIQSWNYEEEEQGGEKKHVKEAAEKLLTTKEAILNDNQNGACKA